MRTTKGLLVLAALALALMGFASSALAAEDGVLRDVTTEEIIPEGTELHATGWAKFEGGAGTVECHVTSVIKAAGATGSTGEVTNFSPDITHCRFTSFLQPCSITATSTANLPYHATVTAPEPETRPAGDIDITAGSKGPIELVQTFAGTFCPIRGVNKVTTEKITLRPLKTGTRIVTNTGNHLGLTAELNEPIAGMEMSATGFLDTPSGGKEAITISGELELTEASRCTWRIAES
jgi:hypothetical protein